MSNQLALIQDNVDYDVVEAMMPMSITERAEMATQLLLAIPQIATRLYEHAEGVRVESRELTQFLYMATDEAITKIQREIDANRMTGQEALQQLYVSCAGQFSTHEGEIRATQQNQSLLATIVEKAQNEVLSAVNLGSANAEAVYKMAQNLVKMEVNMEKLAGSLREGFKKHDAADEKQNEAIKKAAQDLASHKQSFDSLYATCEDMWKQQQRTTTLTDSITQQMEKWKKASASNAEKVKVLEASLKNLSDTIGSEEAMAPVTRGIREQIARVEEERMKMEKRIARGGSIARALETADERINDLARQLRTSQDALAKAEAQLTEIQRELRTSKRENAELKMVTESMLRRIETLENRSPNPSPPLCPQMDVNIAATESQLEDIRRQLRELKRRSEERDREVETIKIASLGRHQDSPYVTANNKLAMAKENMLNVGYVRTSDATTLPIFTDFVGDLMQMEPYAYPTAMHSEFAPLLTAVASKCRRTVEELRVECEKAVDSAYGQTTQRTMEFYRVVEGGSKQEVAEIIVAVEKGKDKVGKVKLLRWLLRARINTSHPQTDRGSFEAEAAGNRGFRHTPNAAKESKMGCGILNF